MTAPGWAPDEVLVYPGGKYVDVFLLYSHEPAQEIKAKAAELAGPLPEQMMFEGTLDEDRSIESASARGGAQ